jgi:CBS domain-containing protein
MLMKVRDVMNSRPVSCQAGDLVSEAARILKKKKISGMPVLDGDRLVGIISESDLLRLLSTEERGQLWLPSPFEVFEVPFRDILKWEKLHGSMEDISKKKISEVMHRDVRKVGPDDSIEEAASIMTRHKINRLPVVVDGKLVGIVTRGDIIAGLGTSHEEA